MIVVTGATGKLGRLIVETLAAKMPAEQIGVSVRDVSKATDLSDRGMRVRVGDFADPAGLAAAFAGAEQVVLVSVNQVGETALQLHKTALEAARAARVRRVLYTSHMGARMDSPFAPASDHAAMEAVLAEGGLPFTSLRHGFYAESALQLVGHGLKAGEIRAPEDGPVSWTARADLAEADAALLVDEGRLDGITPPLTAPQALSMAELAEIASEVTGRTVRRVTLSDNEWLDETTAHGVPSPMAEMLLGMFRAARRGDFAAVDPTLETVLGRPPATMRQVLTSFFKM